MHSKSANVKRGMTCGLKFRDIFLRLRQTTIALTAKDKLEIVF
jgi:hypothetical protein